MTTTTTYEEEEYDPEEDVEYCSICDGLGHGYPGGPACPLERGIDDGFDDWERSRGVYGGFDDWVMV